jgi:hypothetical protein
MVKPTPTFRSEFCKALMKFANAEGSRNMYGNLGGSTRLMGALVMTHSDDQGLSEPANTSGDCSYIQTDEQLESYLLR